MITNSKLQEALFKAAKVGHIKLMRELIEAGANPFALNEDDHNAFFYAEQQACEETAALLRELRKAKETENA